MATEAPEAIDGNGAALPPGVVVACATPDDADTFIAIHEEAARWLWDQGIRQWQPGVFQRAWIQGPIERGELYLAKRSDETLGTVVVQWADEYTWGERPPDAGYIHGLRVRRSAAGQGIGRALLRWAEREIARAGRPFARLDCTAENSRLCAYYVEAGYARQADLEWDEDDERGTLARFEKRVLPEQAIVTPAGMLTVRRAGATDVDALVAIHDEAMRWAFERGFRPSGPPETLRSDAESRLSLHEVYLAEFGGVPAATLTLAWDDYGAWSDLPADAGYVYAYASARSFAGQGVGRALLRWAEEYAALAGKAALRLECPADVPGLRAYYERAGYTARGDIVDHGRALARYEMPLRDEGEHT